MSQGDRRTACQHNLPCYFEISFSEILMGCGIKPLPREHCSDSHWAKSVCEQRAGTVILQVLTSSGESRCGDECLLLPAFTPGPEVTRHGSRGGKSECASGQLST